MPEPRLKYVLLFSIGAAILTLVLKWTAYHLTGSVGLFSEAAESFINLVASVTAFLSLWYASKPVDQSHTYGHEKIEYFSSGLEGVLILVAAGGVGWYSVHRLKYPEAIASLNIGAAINLVAALINLGVARVLLRVGRDTRSIVLEADGRHLMTDFLTSLGVVAGLLLVWLTGQSWLDPVLGLIVSANIAWTGGNLVWRSFNGLMDHALPELEQQTVRAAIEAQLQTGMDYHALRTRAAGSRRFADFHLLVPGSLSVRRAHELAERIEKAVRTALPEIEVTIHIEPIEERAAWEDSELVPLEQAERRAQQQATGQETRGQDHVRT
jgi:cation diffusion facilitator family transporter